MKKLILTLPIIFIFTSLFAQNPIDVAENTLKIGAMSTEEFFYGFSEGDQLIFNFQEVNGKELKEIEIIEYPTSSKFMDYKTAKIENKTINITQTGIYKFRLYNSALSGRICKVKIQRIPASETTRNFNTSVYWRTLYDTNFYTIDEKYLKSRDTAIVPVITDLVQRVHSQTATNGLPNKTTVPVNLPANTISWAYYLGVGPSSEEIFKKAEENAQRTKSQLNAASTLSNGLSKIDPTGSAAMASLLLKGYAEFGTNQNADNVQYWLVRDQVNAQAFMNGQQFYLFDKGNGPLCNKRMADPLKGGFYFCLLNDNIRDGIEVYIRVSAVTVRENWDTRKVEKYTVTSRKEPYLKN